MQSTSEGARMYILQYDVGVYLIILIFNRGFLVG